MTAQWIDLFWEKVFKKYLQKSAKENLDAITLCMVPLNPELSNLSVKQMSTSGSFGARIGTTLKKSLIQKLKNLISPA